MSNNAKALKSGVWYTIANFITKSMVFISTPILPECSHLKNMVYIAIIHLGYL